MKSLPYGRQQITQEDIEAVVNVLRSDFLTQGPLIQSFETAFAKYIGAEYAVAVANGTAALHLSALALKCKEGQKVITSPITFAASANCVRYCGGEVVFSDIDEKSYLLDLEKVEVLLKEDTEGSFAGIIPVNFAGYPVNLEDFRQLANKYGLWILEDACHAPGGYFLDSNVEKQFCGNGRFAELSIFSFHPVKHIACGEGGMITTNDEDLYHKLLELRTHGITKDVKKLNRNPGGWYYEMHELGYNYRLSDIHAALGLSQLQRVDDGLQRRQQIANRYDQAFAEFEEITIPYRKKDISHAFHLYVIQIENRKDLYDFLRKKGVYSQVHYIPVHLLPYYRRQGWREDDFPVAEAYYSRCLSLPMYPSLSEEEQDYVIDHVLSFIQKAARKYAAS